MVYSLAVDANHHQYFFFFVFVFSALLFTISSTSSSIFKIQNQTPFFLFLSFLLSHINKATSSLFSFFFFFFFFLLRSGSLQIQPTFLLLIYAPTQPQITHGFAINPNFSASYLNLYHFQTVSDLSLYLRSRHRENPSFLNLISDFESCLQRSLFTLIFASYLRSCHFGTLETLCN